MKFFIGMVCLLLAISVQAATSKQASKKADGNAALNTNVIGSKEAPTVLNVVPWKKQNITIKPKAPTSRLLDQVLQPLDVNVLDREIEYYQLLHKTANDNDLFLSQ